MLEYIPVELTKMMVMGGAESQLRSGFQSWDGKVDYFEDFDEEAELAIGSKASNA